MPDWLKMTLACALVCLFFPPLLGLFVGGGIVFAIFIAGCYFLHALGVPTQFTDDK